VAANFARGARRSMPFLVKRRSRIVPGAVMFADASPEGRLATGASYEVLLEEPDGSARASLLLNTEALGVVLEGALGGAGGASTAALGASLTVAQAALVSRVVKLLIEDLIRAIKEEVGVNVRLASARAVAAGEEREVEFSDGLGVECVFEGLGDAARLSLAMGAEALEVALKQQEADDPTAGDPRFVEAMHEVPVELVAELGRVSVGLRRLLTLQPGQILRLPTAIDDPAVVRVAGVPKFVGSPAISRGQIAIQIKARHED
jgi:flagellar motor switch/type III secretory pathway protein FliN